MSDGAERALQRLQPKIRKTITNQLATLSYPYEASNVTALQVKNGYRKRIGDYRALYIVDDEEKAVLITEVLIKNETTYR